MRHTICSTLGVVLIVTWFVVLLLSMAMLLITFAIPQAKQVNSICLIIFLSCLGLFVIGFPIGFCITNSNCCDSYYQPQTPSTIVPPVPREELVPNPV